MVAISRDVTTSLPDQDDFRAATARPHSHAQRPEASLPANPRLLVHKPYLEHGNNSNSGEKIVRWLLLLLSANLVACDSEPLPIPTSAPASPSVMAARLTPTAPMILTTTPVLATATPLRALLPPTATAFPPTATIAAPTATAPLTAEEAYYDALRLLLHELGESNKRFRALTNMQAPEYGSNLWRRSITAEVMIWRGVATQAHRSQAPSSLRPLHDQFVTMMNIYVQQGNALEEVITASMSPGLRRVRVDRIAGLVDQAFVDFLRWTDKHR
jgi:hypothetical protein